MKLYNLDHSPYATRVRTTLRKKGLGFSIEAPPVPLKSPAFAERFPLAKIPVLELDDGTQVPDSWVIMEYLEAVAPQPRLAPADPLARAQMQLLARYADTYLGPQGLFPLFQRVLQPAGTDGAEEQLAELDRELARLQRLLERLPDFREREVHLGDIALAPTMDYVLMLAPMFGVEQPLAAYPLADTWWRWVLQDEAVAASSAEMRGAAAQFFG